MLIKTGIWGFSVWSFRATDLVGMMPKLIIFLWRQHCLLCAFYYVWSPMRFASCRLLVTLSNPPLTDRRAGFGLYP